MAKGGDLVLKGARHPVLERNPGYVPNDLTFDKKRRLLLITGPNMGGKSTYLRTAALVTLLAQAGSFTPAIKPALAWSIESSPGSGPAMTCCEAVPPS